MSTYNPAYPYYCHVDCANFVSQALAAGGVPTSTLWSSGTFDWINVGGLYDYMYYQMGYFVDSSYTSCNAGGVILNGNSTTFDEIWDHANLCVMNDTVTRRYAAHNADHNYKTYWDSYWSVYSGFYKIDLGGTT